MLTCDICNKQLNTPQGLAGHKRFVHSANTLMHQQSVQLQALEGQRLDALENRTELLEESRDGNNFIGSDVEELIASLFDHILELQGIVISDIKRQLDGLEEARLHKGNRYVMEPVYLKPCD